MTQVWTPKHIPPRLKVGRYDCAKCGRSHLNWWLTSKVEPPSHAAS